VSIGRHVYKLFWPVEMNEVNENAKNNERQAFLATRPVGPVGMNETSKKRTEMVFSIGKTVSDVYFYALNENGGAYFW